jgi:hypothetical protein
VPRAPRAVRDGGTAPGGSASVASSPRGTEGAALMERAVFAQDVPGYS